MIREICKDILFLSLTSTEATAEDISVAADLKETLENNLDRCVGMAANMIGVNKRIIAVCTNDGVVIMINPVYTFRSDETYEAEEGCLSLEGERPTVRHKKISVEYYDMKFRKKKKTFSDFKAQIIQHEMDHLEGILI